MKRRVSKPFGDVALGEQFVTTVFGVEVRLTKDTPTTAKHESMTIHGIPATARVVEIPRKAAK